VLAFRGAAGLTDERSPDLFSAGGTSGTLLEVFPGYSLGQERRTFGVRGYPAGAEGGIRAYAATVEFRAPLLATSRGFRFIPVFVDRTSLTIFGETGRAYCPRAVTGGVCSPANVGNPAMTSTGVELNFDTSLQLDLPARFRLGVAFPLANREQLGASAAQAYATFGASF
jgi:hemolysin activation/secretion protein